MSAVTCPGCRFKYLIATHAVCPRCKEPPPSQAAVADEAALIEKAKSRYLVWRDDEATAVRVLTDGGIPKARAEELVRAFGKDEREAARLKGTVHVAVGGGVVLASLGVLWYLSIKLGVLGILVGGAILVQGGRLLLTGGRGPQGFS